MDMGMQYKMNGDYESPSVDVITPLGYKELGDIYFESVEHKPVSAQKACACPCACACARG